MLQVDDMRLQLREKTEQLEAEKCLTQKWQVFFLNSELGCVDSLFLCL
jgi:hypothetical protein